MMKVHDCEQGSLEWFVARMGIPTASQFDAILTTGRGKAPSETRLTYLRKLAGEILTGEPMQVATSRDLERGKLFENEARNFYNFEHDADPLQVGFVTNGPKGCSPDSLIGEDGGLEIKVALPHIQIKRLQADELPDEHRAQVQGCMWVCERKWWDFVSYCPKLPLLVVRVERDDDYIENLATEVAKFNDELAATVEEIRQYGSMQEAA